MAQANVIKTDVLIIGGGNAGLFAAINASERNVKVTLVDKAYAGKSGASIMASGWMNVYNPEWGDDWDMLMGGIDMIGSGLNDHKWSEIVMRESYGVYLDCRKYGCVFPAEHEEMETWYAHNMLCSERRAGGHDAATANGGAPFTFIPLRHRGLPPYLRLEAERRGVEIYDRINITELIKCNDEICGAVGFHVEHDSSYVFEAKVTIMCGGNNYFRPAGFHTSSITGDADAMAYRAGAHISGKEFGDGHFTVAQDPAWKGNGELYPAHACFVDAAGNPVPCYGMDLGMTKAVHEGRGPCYWDFDAAQDDDTAALLNYSKKRGNPVETERIGLYPQDGGKWHMVGGHAAGGSEEQMSGIWPEQSEEGYRGKTQLSRLYAAGDCLYTRAWGAISNGAPWGIMPAMVEGKLAGRAAAEFAETAEFPAIDQDYVDELVKKQYVPLERVGGFDPRWVTSLLQNVMYPYYVSQIKTEERLKAALVQVEFFRDHMVPRLKANDMHELKQAHETRNMVLNAEMILRSGMARAESRGRHFREDHPEQSDKYNAWLRIYEKDGKMQLDWQPVPERQTNLGPANDEDVPRGAVI